MRLFAELRRRNVIRMAGLYLVGAWLVVQVAATLLPVFEAPPWVMRALVALLAIGFVAALVLAWVFELTPEGLRRDAEVPATASSAPRAARRMDRAIIVVLLLALGYFALDKFVLAPARLADAAQPPAPAAPAARAPSIAVLAFADLSPDRDSEYLADGIAEEILNALAQVRGLKVAGRTSSFAYKGRNEDLRAIGQALGVAHVLEGSVRRQGDRVRITAQLVQADDGFHLWSESYDGTLDDVFRLQEQVARAVSDALEITLDAGQQARLVDAGTRNAQAYAKYLEATAIYQRRVVTLYPDALARLAEALDFDPGFARAAARTSLIQALLAGVEPLDGPAANAARRFATQAKALDPRLAEPHVALGLLATRARRWIDARESFEGALALAPSDADVVFMHGSHLLQTGYLADGLAAIDRALLIDPAHVNALWLRAEASIDAGEIDAAERAFSRAQALGLGWGWQAELELADGRGDWPEARRLSASHGAPPANPHFGAACVQGGAADYRTLDLALYGGNDAERAAAIALVERCLASRPAVMPWRMHRTLIRVGDPARALEAIRVVPGNSTTGILGALWNREGRAVRRAPGFAAFARDYGFAELWDRHGPPDLCRKDAGGDYRCE